MEMEAGRQGESHAISVPIKRPFRFVGGGWNAEEWNEDIEFSIWHALKKKSPSRNYLEHLFKIDALFRYVSIPDICVSLLMADVCLILQTALRTFRGRIRDKGPNSREFSSFGSIHRLPLEPVGEQRTTTLGAE
jgi:hypothetical protein